MTPRLRKTLLFSVLAIVVAWSISLSKTPIRKTSEVVSVSARHTGEISSSQPSKAGTTAYSPESRLDAEITNDLFPEQSWSRPVRVAVKQIPPPPPPPQLPFRYAGRWQSADKIDIYYLSKGDQTYSARVGEVLDGKWRLAAADGQSLSFYYLPLKLNYSLRMGEPNAQNSPPALASASSK